MGRAYPILNSGSSLFDQSPNDKKYFTTQNGPISHAAIWHSHELFQKGPYNIGQYCYLSSLYSEGTLKTSHSALKLCKNALVTSNLIIYNLNVFVKEINTLTPTEGQLQQPVFKFFFPESSFPQGAMRAFIFKAWSWLMLILYRM